MRATLLERLQDAEKRRYVHLTNWHHYFAWLPTWVADDDCRWLEWVERKLSYHGGSYGYTVVYAEYRPLSSKQRSEKE